MQEPSLSVSAQVLNNRFEMRPTRAAILDAAADSAGRLLPQLDCWRFECAPGAANAGQMHSP